MPRKANYSIQDVRLAVESSFSFAQVLAKLGLRPAGGNYKVLKERLREYAIDCSHFTHQGWSRGAVQGPRRDIQEYLTYPSRWKTSSYALKNRLLKEGLLEKRCQSCKAETWLGRPMPLELDHINGINQDNRIENLRLLCPNCHALTSTYRGKNKGRGDQLNRGGKLM